MGRVGCGKQFLREAVFEGSSFVGFRGCGKESSTEGEPSHVPQDDDTMFAPGGTNHFISLHSLEKPYESVRAESA